MSKLIHKFFEQVGVSAMGAMNPEAVMKNSTFLIAKSMVVQLT
jgi:hypothetical protein